MVLLQEADRQPHDRREQRAPPSADSDRRAAARARGVGERDDRGQADQFRGDGARAAAAHRGAATRQAQGSWFRVQRSGFRVRSSAFRVLSSEFAILYQRGFRRSARLLGRRARPRRDSRRDAAGALGGRGRRARAVQRHQPRHRGARVSGPRAGERAPAHARAVSGGRVSRAGEIRLRQRRRWSSAGPPPCRAGTCSRSIRIRRATSCPRARCTVLPDDVPPPERAVLAANLETAINGLWDARPHVGDRITVIGAGTVGCLVAWIGGTHRRLRRRARRRQPAARGDRRARSASASPIRRRRTEPTS